MLFNVKLIALLETGTCASGNTPFEISRPCPEGTGTDMLLLFGSIIAGLVGAGLFAVRGRPPWREHGGGGAWSSGLLSWALFFSATGAVILIHALSSETIGADGELGGIIVGATFLLMGLPALLIVLALAIGRIRDRRSGGTATPHAGQGGVAALPTHASSDAGSPSGWISSLRPSSSAGRSPRATREPAAWSVAGRAIPAEGDAISRLERLQKLRESGALTDSEFELQKSKILGE